MTVRISIPSKGRLRDDVIDLVRHAGYSTSALRGAGASSVIGTIEFIEMRPRDAAAWLAAGRLDAGFISTDTALEHDVEGLPCVELGFSKSDLVIACRTDAPFQRPADLIGATVATHLPNWTSKYFAQRGIQVNVVPMGGSLEGICARGLADAIVDLRETGMSLIRNSLHAIEVAQPCQAIFAMRNADAPEIAEMRFRIDAALAAKTRHYVMLHIPKDKVQALIDIFPGLVSPTLLPLAGHDDLVAAHIVVNRKVLWERLQELRQLGATGIVALPTDAIAE